MNVFNSSSTLGDLVLAQPAAADLFERLGLDFCCGGSRTLGEAVKERGLDAATVLVMLKSLAESPPAPGAGGHDVAAMTTGELADHIVTEHHNPLRAQLGEITEMLDKVVRVHGDGDSSLAPLREQFVAIRDELTEHMQLEEDELFPACRKIAAGVAADVGTDLLAKLEHTHTDTGVALAQMRELGGGYAQESAHCGTHRRLLESLAKMEADLHQHIHEENNLLFQRVREMLSLSV
ncbi:MAG: DUF542 domain-containing protein [Actinobacteria bacterium]|nr:DUF542 domain-containing protein [Actinomycetota bacterium]